MDNLKLSDTKTILSSYAIPSGKSQVTVALKVLSMLRELEIIINIIIIIIIRDYSSSV